ncbi:hypothetical protein Bbelb_021520 [Branchiostoma belcheri]|nr:hypothetical protein Bbelb_021520 [Branchiostoma belcheri]
MPEMGHSRCRGLTTTQRRKIERIQRRATKIILGHNLPYDLSCKTLNLQTLHDRRETLCHQFGKTLSKSETYNQWLPQQRGKKTADILLNTSQVPPANNGGTFSNIRLVQPTSPNHNHSLDPDLLQTMVG